MRVLILAATLLFSGQVFAQGFINMNQADADAIVEDFSALLSHTTVSGAAPLGDIFGFEVGLVAGVSDVPGIERISKEENPANDVPQLPHAGLVAAVSFPMGITAEANILPEIDAEDGSLSNTSIGAKWTFSKMLGWPVDVAARVSMTQSEFSVTQTSPVPGTKVSYDQDIQAYGVVVSKNFVIVEPYAGFSMLSASGELSATADIFDGAITEKIKGDVDGTSIYGGVNLNLLFFKLGAEVAKVFDSTKASIKLGFYF
jgi:hypothetical protein